MSQSDIIRQSCSLQRKMGRSRRGKEGWESKLQNYEGGRLSCLREELTLRWQETRIPSGAGGTLLSCPLSKKKGIKLSSCQPLALSSTESPVPAGSAGLPDETERAESAEGGRDRQILPCPATPQLRSQIYSHHPETQLSQRKHLGKGTNVVQFSKSRRVLLGETYSQELHF